NIDEGFPYHLIEGHQSATAKRDRIYNEENTLLTMLVTAIQEDKSLKQSVNIFKEVFEMKGKEIKKDEAIQLQSEQDEENRSIAAGAPKKRGPRRLYASRLAKSKGKEVSDNTAAYAKARVRIDNTLVNKIFDYSADFKEMNGKKWQGRETFVTDGTYAQMQDTEELRKKYFVKEGDNAYPQLLLQAVLRQGSGQVHAFAIGTRHQSELELIKPLIEKLPEGSLLLADDLYSTYAVFCLIQKRGCHLIVPGKRDRSYRVIKKIAQSDEIAELCKPKNRPAWISKEQWKEFPATITMRRISFPSPNDEQKECVQYTTIIDEKISAMEIILKYSTRWDIEITIREIKTLMGINVIRSKTEDMAKKEITVALTAYNMIRKIISKSVEQTDFSPQSHFVQECFEADKKLLVDKKGRIYHHWSSGRYGQAAQAD
ncbi:MAG TPA: IS4 family transposase, partial [Hanamia sp.]|nr:IS4 family transposase [Hanamia sp.]